MTGPIPPQPQPQPQPLWPPQAWPLPGTRPPSIGGPLAAMPVPRRHPSDPEEATSTKAIAVLALGIVGVLLMFCGGGLVPGLVGVFLTRPARAEMAAAGGFLTGRRILRAGEVLSWVAVSISAVLIVGVVIGLLLGSVGHPPHYGPGVN